MVGSPGDIGEVQVTQVKRQKGWRTRFDVGEATQELYNGCDVDEATEGLVNEENEL